jgi:hypothetical protein
MKIVKWLKITKNQYFGLFLLGIVFFILQEIPYLFMMFVNLDKNVLMEMVDKTMILNIFEKITGVSCIILMLFLVRDDVNWFSSKREKISLILIFAFLIIYYIGWIFYFNNQQGLVIILVMLVLMPPLYYTFIGLWRKNYLLMSMGIVFLIFHFVNVCNNLL